ncbi:citramalate synthase [Nakamurella multipartita]|jgi:2-isopropylmalate synthase|uniref:Citramalate synthase n=1 Tax=Nakamurella multipartita (strain ATCC 700099 / DSM 44233 / CIP 104796 / JCM 9543 / NBRC 105858 / Y-104) TaxID=479431 RepID=C8XEL4_NAKMY|nr:citramalate synthase [Nakamurella multipartita]ACV77872.1 2-isopropylmalate synthase/homocitrate synthase family protein [Nakamurella multipartita DSM 44233]HOZ59666.1 citramalate synthase [Nakamurella multipartita]
MTVSTTSAVSPVAPPRVATRRSSPLGDAFHVFDTTLRDGAQREGITYSVADKIAVATLLDELGVGFIEGGWPGAMPKDTEFFARAAAGELALTTAKLVAFGATRKAGTRADQDPQVRALLDSGAEVITLVAKSDVRHVERALRTTLSENLAMVGDTVRLLVDHGRRVFLDCEHFFDGYAADRDYGLRVAEAAVSAGADVVVLCDTNGGMLPMGIERVVREVRERGGFRVGIHCQDDTGCAVANTVAAVQAGATHVQCTANGYGERAGNADLFAVVGNLTTKMNLPVLPEGALPEMMRVSHALAELANIAPNTHQAYVGSSAFSHKAGLHASAIKVDPDLYNHLDPTVVGNDMHILITEMAGRASVELKAKELGVDLAGRTDAVGRIVDAVKDREAAGWSYEAADASFELLIRDELAATDAAAAGVEVPPRPFTLESYRVIVENTGGTVSSEATVKVHVGDRRIITTAEGNGPVNALDSALRSAVAERYPELNEVELVDYKVRILAGHAGTDSITRVLVSSSIQGLRGPQEWTTVGVHANVVEASWQALVDALVYVLPSSTGNPVLPT